MRFYWFKIIKAIWTEFNNWQLFNPFFLLESGRGDHFRFGSVFIKKSNQTEIFFFRKNRNRTETGSNRPVLVRFGSVFVGKKPVQTGLARFFPVWLGFSGLARFWLGLARFFVGFGSVRFFRFLFIKPNRPVFSKI